MAHAIRTNVGGQMFEVAITSGNGGRGREQKIHNQKLGKKCFGIKEKEK